MGGLYTPTNTKGDPNHATPSTQWGNTQSLHSIALISQIRLEKIWKLYNSLEQIK